MSLQQEFSDGASSSKVITPEEGAMMLFDCVNKNDMETARKLVEAGVPVDCRNDFNDTPLILAIHRGRTDMALEFLKLKADPNASGDDGFNPLCYAAKAANTFLVDKLLEAGAKPPARGTAPLKALLADAIKGGYEQVVASCLDAGADPDAVMDNDSQKRLLHYAGEKGQSAIVAMLVNAGADINATDKSGRPVLRAAMESNDTDSVMALLNAGADTKNRSVDIKYTGRDVTDESYAVNCNFDIATAAAEASKKFDAMDMAEQGDVEFVKKALEDGSLPVNAKDRYGRAALHRACRASQPEVAKLLVAHGADTGLRAKSGDTPMVIAVGEGCYEIVDMLGTAGVSVMDAGGTKMTPYAYAMSADPAISKMTPALRGLVAHFRDRELCRLAEGAIQLETQMKPLRTIRFKTQGLQG